MRIPILLLALAFTVALGVLTGVDLARYGVTLPGVFGVLIVVLFAVAIIGALTQRPDK